MLGILAGSKRYAHIAGVRGDAVAAKALGLQGMVSEDSVRRALKAIEPEASEPWMRQALMSSVRDALDRPWVLDMDATIKPLYGRQEGAQVGYNPHKPGRPSHVLHTFWVGNLRLVLDAVLTSGKQHTSGHAKAAMARLLDELGDKAPALVRGDCGYGNEDIIDVCEQRDLPYLLRLRRSANVKRLIERLFRREDWTRADQARQGWQAIEDELRLSGWSRARRVVVLRRRIKHDIALTAKKDNDQLVLALPHDEVQDNAQVWEYTVASCLGSTRSFDRPTWHPAFLDVLAKSCGSAFEAGARADQWSVSRLAAQTKSMLHLPLPRVCTRPKCTEMVSAWGRILLPPPERTCIPCQTSDKRL